MADIFDFEKYKKSRSKENLSVDSGASRIEEIIAYSKNSKEILQMQRSDVFFENYVHFQKGVNQAIIDYYKKQGILCSPEVADSKQIEVFGNGYSHYNRICDLVDNSLSELAEITRQDIDFQHYFDIEKAQGRRIIRNDEPFVNFDETDQKIRRLDFRKKDFERVVSNYITNLASIVDNIYGLCVKYAQIDISDYASRKEEVRTILEEKGYKKLSKHLKDRFIFSSNFKNLNELRNNSLHSVQAHKIEILPENFDPTKDAVIPKIKYLVKGETKVEDVYNFTRDLNKYVFENTYKAINLLLNGKS